MRISHAHESPEVRDPLTDLELVLGAVQKFGSAAGLAREMDVGSNTPNEWLRRLRQGGKLSADKRRRLKDLLREPADVTAAPPSRGSARPAPPAETFALPPAAIIAGQLQGAMASLSGAGADFGPAILDHLSRQVQLLTTLAAAIAELKKEVSDLRERGQPAAEPAQQDRSKKRPSERRRAAG